jgi:hypothetical protein
MNDQALLDIDDSTAPKLDNGSNGRANSWVAFILLNGIAPLLVSTWLLAMVANVTGSGPWSATALLTRNHLVPTLFVVVTWNGLLLMARFARLPSL